eukprot:scaffold77827_cov16-Tisochrysis_lutea.AAC.4
MGAAGYRIHRELLKHLDQPRPKLPGFRATFHWMRVIRMSIGPLLQRLIDNMRQAGHAQATSKQGGRGLLLAKQDGQGEEEARQRYRGLDDVDEVQQQQQEQQQQQQQQQGWLRRSASGLEGIHQIDGVHHGGGSSSRGGRRLARMFGQGEEGQSDKEPIRRQPKLYLFSGHDSTITPVMVRTNQRSLWLLLCTRKTWPTETGGKSQKFVVNGHPTMERCYEAHDCVPSLSAQLLPVSYCPFPKQHEKASLFAALGAPLSSWPPFVSNVVLELWGSKGKGDGDNKGSFFDRTERRHAIWLCQCTHNNLNVLALLLWFDAIAGDDLEVRVLFDQQPLHLRGGQK